MKEYSMYLITYDDNNNEVYHKYVFNKKRLFKVIQSELGVSNPKWFLSEEYNSDDTSVVIDEFLLNGWNYKEKVV